MSASKTCPTKRRADTSPRITGGGDEMRTRIKLGIVAAVVAASGALAVAPAQASACHPDPLGPDVSGEEQICYTIMRVVCAPFEKFGGCPIR
jgi:hypothetical protein